MMFEAQAWMKGKSKGKTKGHAKDGPGHRSVNAYTSDLFLGGLDVSEAMEITGTGVQTASPSVGMLDCGATASAAPKLKAIVRSLISAVSFMTRMPRLNLSNPRDRSKRQKGSNANAFLSVQYYLQGVCLASMASMVSMACMVSWVSVVSMVSMAFLFLDLGFYGLHGCHGFLGLYGFHAFRGFHGFHGFYGYLGFHGLCGFQGFLGVHGFYAFHGFHSFLRPFYIHGFFHFHDFHTCGCETTPSMGFK